jgi:hypothetical protein
MQIVTSQGIAFLTRRPDLVDLVAKTAGAVSRQIHNDSYFAKDLKSAVVTLVPMPDAQTAKYYVTGTDLPNLAPSYPTADNPSPSPTGNPVMIRLIKEFLCRDSSGAELPFAKGDVTDQYRNYDRWGQYIGTNKNYYFRDGAGQYRVQTFSGPLVDCLITYYTYPELLNTEDDWIASEYKELLEHKTAQRVLQLVGRDKEAAALSDSIQSLERELMINESYEEEMQ